MVPPLSNKTRLAQDIRTKLSRFSWIAPLLALQSEVGEPAGASNPTLTKTASELKSADISGL